MVQIMNFPYDLTLHRRQIKTFVIPRQIKPKLTNRSFSIAFIFISFEEKGSCRFIGKLSVDCRSYSGAAAVCKEILKNQNFCLAYKAVETE